MSQDISIPQEQRKYSAISTETLRRQYKPDRIVVLLVGESRPASGTFFYKGDSNLYRFTREAFARTLSLKHDIAQDFLKYFKDLGFFLEDLCQEPVNARSNALRRKLRREAIPPFAERLRNCTPQYVITVMKGIEQHVKQAASLASMPRERLHVLLFPANGHQRGYVEGLSEILLILLDRNVIQ